MMNDSATLHVHCKHCGSALTVELDRADPDLRHRQAYLCPACTKREEGIFAGRVVRVTRRWTAT